MRVLTALFRYPKGECLKDAGGGPGWHEALKQVQYQDEGLARSEGRRDKTERLTRSIYGDTSVSCASKHTHTRSCVSRASGVASSSTRSASSSFANQYRVLPCSLAGLRKGCGG